jgi:hypothetical protein
MQVYQRSSEEPSTVSKADVQLNGEVLKRSAGDELPTLKPIHLSAGPVELQPASISFRAVLKAGNPNCRQR